MKHRDLAQSPLLHRFENPGEAWREAMRQGDFERAWEVNDWVLARRNPAERDDPALPYHLRWVWDGRPFEGEHVLVRCYHGLGDTLQFCRYLAPLRRRVRSLALEVQPALAPLLTDLAGPDRLIPFRPEAPVPPSACDLEIMELAHALRTPPDPTPYLMPSGATIPSPEGGRGQGEGPLPPAGEGERTLGLRVGICWHVNTGWAPERSVPIGCLRPLGAIPGVTLFSLQRGSGASALSFPVANQDDNSTDMVATARLVRSLDLVVTIDTMVAHLAGALGVPVYLLLPHAPDWRWLAGGRGSPWYRNVQKYQQCQEGNWTDPVTELVSDLTQAARRHSVTGT